MTESTQWTLLRMLVRRITKENNVYSYRSISNLPAKKAQVLLMAEAICCGTCSVLSDWNARKAEPWRASVISISQLEAHRPACSFLGLATSCMITLTPSLHPCTGHLDAAKLLAIDVPNPHVWDIVDPHTPPRVKLGLQSPSKQHLVYSSFRKRRLDFCSLVK